MESHLVACESLARIENYSSQMNENDSRRACALRKKQTEKWKRFLSELVYLECLVVYE